MHGENVCVYNRGYLLAASVMATDFCRFVCVALIPREYVPRARARARLSVCVLFLWIPIKCSSALAQSCCVWIIFLVVSEE